MKNRVLAIGIVVLGSGVTWAAARADCVDWSVYPHQVGIVELPSSGTGVDVAGDHVYVGDFNEGLQVVNVADLRNPTVVGSVAIPGLAGCVDVEGTIACVGGEIFDQAYVGKLDVVDVTNPQAPVLQGTVRFPGSMSAAAVSIRDDLAFVAALGVGLCVVDISDAEHPAIVGVLQGFEVRHVCLDGPYAYLAVSNYGTGQGGLVIADVSDPAAPFLVGGITDINGASGVAVAGHLAYLADGGEGLVVVDIADPSAPRIVAQSGDHGADGVVLSSTHAFVMDDYLGTIYAINITDPLHPWIECGIPGTGDGMVLRDGTIFTTGGRNEFEATGVLQIVDVSSPGAPEVGRVPLPGFGSGVVVAGAFAYVACWDAGLRVVDVTDPLDPQIVGSLSGTARDIALSFPYVYSTTGYGIQVIDVSVPDAPHLVHYMSVSSANRVTVHGGFLYVSAPWSQRFVIMSLSDPVHPNPMCYLTMPDDPYGCAVRDHYAYVTDERSGLQVVDISNPYTAHIVGSALTGALAAGIALTGDCACMADGYYGFEAIDIANPAHPVVLANLRPEGGAVATCGPYAYLGLADGGMRQVDLTDCAEPRATGSFFVPGWVGDIAATEQGIFLVGEGGLTILPPQCETTAVIEAPDTVGGLRIGAFPNPTTGAAVIRLELPREMTVTVSVFDVAGRLVRRVYEGKAEAGHRAMAWDGRDDAGAAMPSGTYFCRLTTQWGVETRKLQLVR